MSELAAAALTWTWSGWVPVAPVPPAVSQPLSTVAPNVLAAALVLSRPPAVRFTMSVAFV